MPSFVAILPENLEVPLLTNSLVVKYSVEEPIIVLTILLFDVALNLIECYDFLAFLVIRAA